MHVYRWKGNLKMGVTCVAEDTPTPLILEIVYSDTTRSSILRYLSLKQN